MIEGFTHQASLNAARRGHSHNAARLDRSRSRKTRRRRECVVGGPILSVWELDFFNRSVGRAYTIPGTYDTLPMTQVKSQRPDGLLRDRDNRPVEASYVLTDENSRVRGVPVARDRTGGMTLYRVGGAVRVQERVDGLFPDTGGGGSVRSPTLRLSGRNVGRWHQHRSRASSDRPVTVTALSKGGDPTRSARPPARALERALALCRCVLQMGSVTSKSRLPRLCQHSTSEMEMLVSSEQGSVICRGYGIARRRLGLAARVDLRRLSSVAISGALAVCDRLARRAISSRWCRVVISASSRLPVTARSNSRWRTR